MFFKNNKKFQEKTVKIIRKSVINSLKKTGCLQFKTMYNLFFFIFFNKLYIKYNNSYQTSMKWRRKENRFKPTQNRKGNRADKKSFVR